MSLSSFKSAHDFWAGKSVLVTGHTGFKGTWLSLWLTELGARVHGASLAPENHPSMFDAIGLSDRLASHSLLNINDLASLWGYYQSVQPEIIFHLAAQALVRPAHYNPINTLATNVMGTAHVLEAMRLSERPTTAVLVTTDKVYDNREWIWPYREQDRLGGHEPYAASKAAAELVIAAYRHAYFTGTGVKMSSVRAGNVIGGGDWSIDRLIPDAVRSFGKNEPLTLRNPAATRPWQHVFEPLFGYLDIAMALHSGLQIPAAMNFGPELKDVRPVGVVSQMIADYWGDDARVEFKVDKSVRESQLLALDNSLARNHLNWAPTFSLEQAISATVNWYKAYSAGDDMLQVSLEQLIQFGKQYYTQ